MEHDKYLLIEPGAMGHTRFESILSVPLLRGQISCSIGCFLLHCDKRPALNKLR